MLLKDELFYTNYFHNYASEVNLSHDYLILRTYSDPLTTGSFGTGNPARL